MYSISKCDTTILTSCTLLFYYINKLALLFAQQCQAPISPNRILAQLCSCISLIRILKNKNLFFIFYVKQVLVYRGYKWQILGQQVLNFPVLTRGFYCIFHSELLIQSDGPFLVYTFYWISSEIYIVAGYSWGNVNATICNNMQQYSTLKGLICNNWTSKLHSQCNN